MIYLNFVAMLLICVGTVAGLVRCFHMLQQNSYKPERYVSFGKTAPKGRWFASLVAALVLLALAWWERPVLLVLLLVWALVCALPPE